MSSPQSLEKNIQLSGKYELAQYILGADFKKRIGDNDELKNLLNEELRILEGFYGLAFDTGLARIRSYRGEIAPPVYLLRRTVGFGKLFADEDNLEDGTLEILFMQVHNIKKLDQLIDEQGRHAADVVLNTIALETQIAIAEVQASQAEDSNGEDIACRYSEDEFAVILRNRSESYREKLIQKIQNKIQSKNIEMLVHIVKTPPDELQKRIYLAFLKRATILNEKQIKKIQERMETSDLDFVERSIYHSTVTSIDDKREFILHTHPELRTPFRIAQILDSPDSHIRTEMTLKLIENIFFNKVLGTDIYSFVDLQWRIAQGEFSELWVIDFKFLREINDSLSIIDGDESLEKIYSALKNIFKDEDRKKIMMFQRGGIFIIAILKGSFLSEETQKTLQYLVTANIYEETNLEVPLGRSKIELTPRSDSETEEQTVQRTHSDLEKALYLADLNWYHRMVDLIDDELEEYSNLLKAEEWRVEEEMNESHVMTLSYLVWHFFHGKEGYYRSRKALELVKGRKELTEIFDSLITS